MEAEIVLVVCRIRSQYPMSTSVVGSQALVTQNAKRGLKYG